MPQLTENSYENYALQIRELAERMVEELLQLQREFSEEVIKNPVKASTARRKFNDRARDLFRGFLGSSSSLVEENLPEMYLRGLESINAQAQAFNISSPRSGISMGSMLLVSAGGIGGVGASVPEILASYPQHITMYQVFEAAAKRQLSQMELPVLRSVDDGLRQVVIESGRREFLSGNTTTRRKVTQDVLDRLADKNITGMLQTGGRRYTAAAYTEMATRTVMANANRQAAMNRQQQFGLDLVRISSHSPCSDLCRPWQGRVYSISGTSSQYPPLSEAISGGLYHPNCKHSQSAYHPGYAEALKNPGQFADDATKDSAAFKVTQQQRYVERKIREWKRREMVALSDSAKREARKKVSFWQAKNRALVEEHGYLKRKYYRETI